jgi:hypothetical protein
VVKSKEQAEKRYGFKPKNEGLKKEGEAGRKKAVYFLEVFVTTLF